MQTLKQFIIGCIILGGLFFLFGPEVFPENFQPPEILDTIADNDIVIVFNSGGWGNTPFEDAEDFAPIIKGVQETLNGLGYKTAVISFNRTKDNLTGKIAGARDFFGSFNFSSEILAKDVESLVKNLPDKKIILAGLSNGAAFVSESYEKISEEAKDSVYAIAVGTPFWTETVDSGNILQLDNNGKDSLVRGDVKSLILSLIKTPFSKDFLAPGHNYFWNSPEVNFQIVSFLEKKFR
jgi:hypothetical protein